MMKTFVLYLRQSPSRAGSTHMPLGRGRQSDALRCVQGTSQSNRLFFTLHHLSVCPSCPMRRRQGLAAGPMEIRSSCRSFQCGVTATQNTMQIGGHATAFDWTESIPRSLQVISYVHSVLIYVYRDCVHGRTLPRCKVRGPRSLRTLESCLEKYRGPGLGLRPRDYPILLPF